MQNSPSEFHRSSFQSVSSLFKASTSFFVNFFYIFLKKKSGKYFSIINWIFYLKILKEKIKKFLDN